MTKPLGTPYIKMEQKQTITKTKGTTFFSTKRSIKHYRAVNNITHNETNFPETPLVLKEIKAAIHGQMIHLDPSIHHPSPKLHSQAPSARLLAGCQRGGKALDRGAWGGRDCQSLRGIWPPDFKGDLATKSGESIIYITSTKQIRFM